MKLWAGRFTAATDKRVEIFNASIFFDKALYLDDIVGSAAHVRMLRRINVLSDDEATSILSGLKSVLADFENDQVSLSAVDEDIHMAVETRLREKIGAVAGKLHTGRSRNDQVALDMHLFARRAIVEVVDLLIAFIETLHRKATDHKDAILPGYTHLQRAQPVKLAHHLLAYIAMFNRDIGRFQDLFSRTNNLPLGSGAIAGSTFPLDRQYVAKLLKFDTIYSNSMDAVSDRDYIVEFLAAVSLTMTHLSRLSEEIILWSSSEFRFIELHDSFCTGSSMMPQKKNPDIAELVRGKTGRTIGALVAMLTTLKGLPMTYNKDMQEDKEGFFDAFETVSNSLALYTPMIATMTINEERMLQATREDFSNATDLADYLVRKGLPFREAHEVVGKLVRHAIDKGCYLTDLSITEFQTYSSLIEGDILEELQIERVVARRVSEGGTSATEVTKQLNNLAATVPTLREWHAHREIQVAYNRDDLFSLQEHDG